MPNAKKDHPSRQLLEEGFLFHVVVDEQILPFGRQLKWLLLVEAQKKHNEGFSEQILMLGGSSQYGAFPE